MTFEQHLINLEEILFCPGSMLNEAQPLKVCVFHYGREVHWASSKQQEDKALSQENPSHTGHDSSVVNEGVSKPYMTISFL